jgi:hypothetical protein
LQLDAKALATTTTEKATASCKSASALNILTE